MTAYEMRISDWSSDVCSSDLLAPDAGPAAIGDASLWGYGRTMTNEAAQFSVRLLDLPNARSEERRVGKECVSTSRSRWAPNNQKKNKDKSDVVYSTSKTL